MWALAALRGETLGQSSKGQDFASVDVFLYLFFLRIMFFNGQNGKKGEKVL